MTELNLRERGLYNSILDLLYSRDGMVPDDDARVARMISIHWREYSAIKKRLFGKGKLWSENGMLMAKRVQRTLKEAAELSQEQRKRVSQRWQKQKYNNQINDRSIPAGIASTSTTTSTIRGVRDLERKEGFKAHPSTAEFKAWKEYYTKINPSYLRELDVRELEGRAFEFESQWPPNTIQ